MRDASIVNQIDTNGEPLPSLSQKQTHISNFVLSKPNCCILENLTTTDYFGEHLQAVSGDLVLRS
jgi:hypothetical protein